VALLRKEIQAFGPDIVHIHISGGGVQVTLAAWLAQVPMVGHFWGLPSPGLTELTLNKVRLARIFFRRRNLITLTPEGQRYFAQRGLESYVVPNAVDIAAFDRAVGSLPKALDDSGVSKILCPARLAPVKNHAMLLRAMRHVILEEPRAALYLAGDGPLLEPLQALARELGIEEQVVFLGYRDDVPALMRDCDVVCLTSWTEGFPRVLIEAGAARKPCVVTDIIGPREVIVDGETGFVVPPDDDNALAERILHLLKVPELRERMGEAARRRVEQYYTLERQVELVDQVYAEVLARTGRRKSVS
jgi:glycosyltransferase involved in cell wall biosynthesis